MDPLKELLFQKTLQARKSYEEAMAEKIEMGEELAAITGKNKFVEYRRQRFISLYDVIETAELEDEYWHWRETQQ